LDSLTKKILPAYLQGCRWFGGKSRIIQAIRIVNDFAVSLGPSVIRLVCLEVRYSGGISSTYLLPLAFLPKDKAASLFKENPHCIVANLSVGGLEGVVYDGAYSKFRKKKYGAPTIDIPSNRFVICTQNHDQVGNRAFGNRLNSQISFDAQKCAGALLLTTPNTPLLFMGQEYGETHPFQYFIDHSDPNLIEATRKGRKAEFASFGWDDIPDPMSEASFSASRLDWDCLGLGHHPSLLRLYQDLIAFRRSNIDTSRIGQRDILVYVNEKERWFAVAYPSKDAKVRIGLLISFLKKENEIKLPFEKMHRYEAIINTAEEKYGGTKKNGPIQLSKTMLMHSESAIVGKIL